MNSDNERLRNMLISDKHFNTAELERVLKNDIYFVLQNYATVNPQNIEINLTLDDDGFYNININTKTNRLKIFGSRVDN